MLVSVGWAPGAAFVLPSPHAVNANIDATAADAAMIFFAVRMFLVSFLYLFSRSFWKRYGFFLACFQVVQPCT